MPTPAPSTLPSGAPTAALTFADGTLLRYGQPHRMLSGSVHYFRVHPEQWEDRLTRLAAMGANTVDTYVPWNFHEQTEGQARFDGWRDVGAFLTLARDRGLDVLLRPSPFICAEWSGGGLPGWVTARTRPGAVRTSDPGYLAAVEGWYATLIPYLAPHQATRGGSVVAVQVENEYGSFGSDRSYPERLRDLLRQHGITELLTTADGTLSDMQRNGSIDGALPTFTFGTGVPAAQALLADGVPLVCSELWGGWFDHWGERHHVRSAENMAATLRELLEAGGSVSLYMAHGGTNFGLGSGANWDGVLQPTITSYDSDAPIGEDGTLGEKFHAVRELFAPFHDGPLPSVPPPPRFQPPQQVPFSPQRDLFAVVNDLPYGPRQPAPATFEDLGVEEGMVAYRATVDLPARALLRVAELRDRAVVFLDGQRVATVQRDGVTEVQLENEPTTAELTLVVESLGRINYGSKVGERKGIAGGVLAAHRYLHGWRHAVVPLVGDPPALEGPHPETAAAGDAVAEVTVAEPADAWLAFPGGGRGYVWLNGFLLGRYWSIGPQVTLYAPGPLWRQGRNVVRVLDLDACPTTLEVRERPELGEREEFVGS